MTSTKEQARRLADMRRSLMSLHAGEYGRTVALNLMGVMLPSMASPEQNHWARVICDSAGQDVARFDLMLADEQMSTLVDEAAPSMPDQMLREDDPIGPYGLVRFIEPVPDRTSMGPHIPLQALSWAYLPADHPLLERDTDSTSVLITAYVRGSDLQAIGVPFPAGMLPPSLVPFATVIWKVGTPIGVARGEVPDEEDAWLDPGFYQRLAAAFWTLAKQPLAETVDAPELPSKDVQRYRRAGIERPGQAVRVVRLRRRRHTGPAGEPTGRTLGVRFVVRGHWRNQWLPSLKDHRQTYIAPHLKGPEDAPLQGGEKVLLVTGAPPADPAGGRN